MKSRLHVKVTSSRRRFPLIFLFIRNYYIENEYREMRYNSVGFSSSSFSPPLLFNNERKNIGYLISSFLSSPTSDTSTIIPKSTHRFSMSIVQPAIYIVRYTIHFPNYNPIIVYSSKLLCVCEA